MRSLVHDHEMRQAILARTHHDVIRQWQRLVPESDTPLWMGGTEEQLRKRLTELRAADFEGVTQLQVHVRLNTNNAAEPFNFSRALLRARDEALRPHRYETQTGQI